MLRVAFEFMMFVGSTGVFFNEDFRKSTFAVLVAGVIALASTITLFISVNDLLKNGQPATLATPSAPTITPADEIFWLSIKDSAVAGLFEEFEKRFPTSKHLGEARTKIEQLRASQNSISPPVIPSRDMPTAKTPQKICVTFNNRQICE